MLSAVTLVALSLASRVDAIQFIQDYNEIDRPSFDPYGTELRRIATAAAIIWEDYILDDRTFEFDLSWENIDGDRVGEFRAGVFVDDAIVFDTHDSAGNLRNWFFDPTPLENEEYGMLQSLYRNGASEPGIAGTAPELLETGYVGYDGSQRLDLLTIALHEMGHFLGINLGLGDSAFNLNPATLGGANVSVFATDEPWEEFEHLEVSTALMSDSATQGFRRLPSAIDILALWDESGFTQFDLPRVDFIGAESTDWDGTLNWIGGRVPDDDNQVFVRNGGSVRLTGDYSTAKSLAVDENSRLITTNNTHLRVYGPVSLGGNFTGEIHLGNILPGGAPTLEAYSLDVASGLVNLQAPTSVVDVSGDLYIGSRAHIRGDGTVKVGGTLNNRGEITGGTLFPLNAELTVRTTGGGRLDLDGDEESGRITASLGNLRIEGTLLENDPFSGVATIEPGRTITVTQPWSLDGRLVMHGGAAAASPAILGGAAVALSGQVETDGHAIINTTVALVDASVWNVEGTLSTGSISGSGGAHTFTKTGAGTLVANLSSSGAKTFEQGAFQGSINGAGAATFMPGAAFRLIGGSSSPITLHGAGDSSFLSLHKRGQGTSGLSGLLTIERNPNISVDAGGILTLSGGIMSVNDSGFIKSGDGELVISGPGAGPIVADIRGGQLTIAHNNALGAGRVFVQPLGGGSLALAEAVTFANQISMVQGRILGLGNSTVASDITLFPSGNHTFEVPQFDHTLTFSGSIADFGGGASLTKTGAGAVALTGNSTIIGGLTVAEGVLANHGVIASGATHVTGNALLLGSGQFADVNVRDNGRFAPGGTPDLSLFSPATVAIRDFVLSAAGQSRSELLIQLGGLTPGFGHDQLLVSGNATLAG
ncbi:MAG: hypothetical protein H0T51_07610, partial [Pirellulales bacterium]|nr:hypothetical protein [Pirellulales bacterium]